MMALNIITFVSILILSPVFSPCFPPISYLAMCGLVFQSMVYERNYDMHLLKMTQSIAESTLATTDSVKNQDVADELRQQSLEEAKQSEKYQSEATFFQQKSEEEQSQALADEDTGDALAEKASEESIEGTEWTTKAAEEEGIYEIEIVEGDSEVAEVAVLQEEIEEVGIATVLCNLIPFVDLACDAVGATIEVSTDFNNRHLTS